LFEVVYRVETDMAEASPSENEVVAEQQARRPGWQQ
jgi:hypothetical protein